MKSLHAMIGACGLLLMFHLAGCKEKSIVKPIITTDTLEDKADGRPPEAFADLATDVFPGMDGGVKLTEDEVKGRNTWNLWCGGDEQFWDKMAREGFGLFDLLKTIDSRDREVRLNKYGLINQPGFKKAAKPDKYGLWIDEGTEPAGIDPAVFGRPTGLMGFRLFDNPDFKGAAVEEWKKHLDPATGEAKKFYEDPDFAVGKDLIRPYRVGVSCGSCHIAYHPCSPPENPNEPKYENLASAIGNQYIKEGATFAPNVREGGFFCEMLKTQPRGTSDTSRIATDNINNPNAINPIFLLGVREKLQVEEELAGGSLALAQFTKPKTLVAHILKDGADSIGIPGATIRVYVNIGMHHQQWLQRHNALIGLIPQEPFDIATARKNSTFWLATEQKVPNVAAFFRRLEPYHLEDAMEKGEAVGKKYITEDAEVMKRGKTVFAENCATCHSSKRPPAGKDEVEWFTEQILTTDFRKDNFFSDEKRYPITRIKTNAGRACGTNAMAGHIWDNFSSQTYKELKSVGTIQVWNPYTEKDEDFKVPGGGPGYYRTPSLISIWSSAPFLHNNMLGEEPAEPNPSVAGRMKAFDDAVQKLLWPEKRKGKESIWRTSRDCGIQLQASRLPPKVVDVLRRAGHIEKDPDGTEFFRIGHIPEGTPINLLANVNPDPDPSKLHEFADLLIKVKVTLAKIKLEGLDAPAAKAEMKKEIAPALFKVSKCPDLIVDHGHTFGSELADADKLALIEYLKTL
ncbi:MAG: hypothetical protein QOE70_4439 [Chthoniobacter sp.]|jgi:hypothetical protein|nr:hypothetical protein [Chthoniobacter sp.]